MRTVLLAMLTRRQGMSFQLKTAGYELIGTMTLNTATAQHEMEISEADFLRHTRELARICAVPGMGWYVVEFRGVAPAATRKKKKMVMIVAAAAPDELDQCTFFSLRKIAKDEDIDISGVNGCATIRDTIRAARKARRDAERDKIIAEQTAAA